MKRPTVTDVAACMFANYVKSITDILNMLGVEDTVAMLRRSANDLENHRELLETARRRRTGRVGVA